MAGIVVAVLVLLLVWPAQLRTRPILVRRLVVLPVAITLIGLAVLAWERPHMGSAQGTYLAAQLVIAVVAGVARGAAMDLTGRGGYAVSQGSWRLPVGWAATLGARLGLDALTVALASTAAIVATFPLFLGVTACAQSAALWVRVRQRGLRFVSPATWRRWRAGRQHLREQGVPH